MKVFQCQCGNTVFFANTRCQQCGRPLGYCPDLERMAALEPAGEGLWAVAGGGLYRHCNNYAYEDVCNWMVPATDPEPFCRACRLNEIIPDLSQPRHRQYWYKIEAAKRHMLYTLYQLRLPVISRREDPQHGLAFTFLADTDSASEFTDPIHGQEAVLTGHSAGRITINLAEADDVARARMREQLQERYRTLLGHFRHEIGHYYWDRLVRDVPARLAGFRQVFSDERRDYAGALALHYRQGPPPDWEQHYISSYASMHPWEDWAETWAHYMHMVDTLETAQVFGIVQAGRHAAQYATDHAFNPAHEDFDALVERWVRLTVAMNAINHSMGLPDAYPFVLQAVAREKLRYIHRLIAGLNDGG
jgi:hypothetical protein